MTKTTTFLLLMIWIPVVLVAQQFTNREDAIAKINQRLNLNDSLSFDVYRVNYTFDGNPIEEPRKMCHFERYKNLRTFKFKDFMVFQFNRDSAWYVNYTNGWCVRGSIIEEINGINEFSLVYRQFTEELSIYGYFLLANPYPPFADSSYSIQYLGDSVINNIQCAAFERKYLGSFKFNPETQEYDIPIYDTLRYFFDISTWNLYCINHSCSSWENEYQTFLFDNFCTSVADSNRVPMDFSDKKYAEFKLFNSCMAPYYEYYEDDVTKVPDTTLLFPLVRASGDTIRLIDDNGWKLINYWCFGCAPCFKFFVNLNKERELNGTSALEMAGIRLYLVNPNCVNTSTFKNAVERFNIADIAYASQGLPGLAYPFTPYFYLIAPNGEIAYSGHFENSQQLIDIKNEYEKNSH